MASFVATNLAPINFASLVLFLLLGYPVAFSLAANGLAFLALAVWLSPHAPEAISLSWPLLCTLPDRVFGVMANEVLLAIPLFTFMGLSSLLIMLRYGYDRRLAAGVIAASGTLAQIIPPSPVLNVMTDQLGRSAGDMYEGALRLTGSYAEKTITKNDHNKEEMP